MNARMRVILKGWGCDFRPLPRLPQPLFGGGRTDPVLDVGSVRPGVGHRRSRRCERCRPRGQELRDWRRPGGGRGRPAGECAVSSPVPVQQQPPLHQSPARSVPSVTIPWLPVLDPTVSTSATQEQLGLYPAAFRDLIAHPDWFHTTSFRVDAKPMMDIFGSAEPYDPTLIRPVPEPSSIVVFAITLADWAGKLAKEGLTRPLPGIVRGRRKPSGPGGPVIPGFDGKPAGGRRAKKPRRACPRPDPARAA